MKNQSLLSIGLRIPMFIIHYLLSVLLQILLSKLNDEFIFCTFADVSMNDSKEIEEHVTSVT